MAFVNIVLVCVMREKKRATISDYGGLAYNFRKERCTLLTLLFLFELSYLSRFLWATFGE